MIERRRRGTTWIVVLVECPACGESLRGKRHPSAHVHRHDPEDFGLTPLRGSEVTRRAAD
jgi:hypothetical protein